MFKQLKANKINEIIISLQSYLYHLYCGENVMIGFIITDITMTLEKMEIVDINTIATMSPETIISGFYK